MEALRWSGVVVAVALAAAVAHAQPQTNQARAHFKSGTELYDENNFRGALVEFQRAYELAPSYKILFNIGQVDMELQDYAGALKAYTRYLREGGPDVPASRVTQVQGEIERLKGRVGRLTVDTAPGAEVLIDDLSVGFAPLPDAVPVNAGRHQVTVHITGKDPLTRVVDVAGQQQLTVALGNDLVARGARPAGPQGPPSKVPMYLMWTLTGAFAATSVTFDVIAESDSSQLSKLRSTFPVSKTALSSQESKVTRSAAIADGFAAGTLVAGGIALYMTLTRPAAQPHEKKVELLVSPTGAFVAGRF